MSEVAKTQPVNPIKKFEQAFANVKNMKDIMAVPMVSQQYIANYEAFSGNNDGMERFKREAFALMEIASNKPEILGCDPISILAGFIKTATYGISLQSKKWSVYPRNLTQTDGSKKKMLVVDLDAHGKREMLEKQDNIDKVDEGVVVLTGDTFVVDPHAKKVVKHEQKFPRPKATKESVVAAYCTVHFKDGHYEDVVMDINEIEVARSKSPMPEGDTWTKSYGEMCKKSTYNRSWKIHGRTPEPMKMYKKYDIDQQDETNDITHQNVSDVMPQLQQDATLDQQEQSVPDNVDQSTGEVITPTVVESTKKESFLS